MSEERITVATEINDYVEDIDGWIGKASSASVNGSCKSVIDRFVRDCQTFKNDVSTTTHPTNADLNDFNDRHASLEVQFHNLQSDLK